MANNEHLRWMKAAMEMVSNPKVFKIFVCLISNKAEEALAAGEVPVGCVFVRDGEIIAKARNRTNELRNVRAIMFYPSFWSKS